MFGSCLVYVWFMSGFAATFWPRQRVRTTIYFGRDVHEDLKTLKYVDDIQDCDSPSKSALPMTIRA
jgi:hypothetical protein